MKPGDRIQKLRLDRGLSLSELAERSEVAKSYLSAMERHIQVNPSIQVLEKIAKVLDVPIQSILYPEAELDVDALDPGWLDIVRDAMHSGVTKEQFREFLEFQKWRKQE